MKTRDEYESNVAKEALITAIQDLAKSHGAECTEVPMFDRPDELRVLIRWK